MVGGRGGDGSSSLATSKQLRGGVIALHNLTNPYPPLPSATLQLSRSIPTIEDVAELEEYMAQLPAEMEENQNGLAQMMSDQLVLDEFE